MAPIPMDAIVTPFGLPVGPKSDYSFVNRGRMRRSSGKDGFIQASFP